MAFTATHYNRVAEIIRERKQHNATDANYAEGWHACASSVQLHIARMFAQDNPRFDVERFNAACEPKGEKA